MGNVVYVEFNKEQKEDKKMVAFEKRVEKAKKIKADFDKNYEKIRKFRMWYLNEKRKLSLKACN